MKKLNFYIRLFLYFLSKNIQAKMSYSLNFIIGIVANIFKQSLGFIFIWIIFRNINEIENWNFMQIAFVYGMQAITIGLNQFLFAGTWSVGRLIREGELDRLMLYPVGTIFSIITYDIAFHGLGSVLFGFAICIVSLHNLSISISLGMFAFWLVAIICGSMIYFSINMLCATLSFWILDASSAMMIAQNLSEFSKYPISIYSSSLQFLLTLIVPLAFTSFYPATIILKMDNSFLSYFSILIVTSILLILVSLFWNYGLSKYDSAG